MYTVVVTLFFVPRIFSFMISFLKNSKCVFLISILKKFKMFVFDLFSEKSSKCLFLNKNVSTKIFCTFEMTQSKDFPCLHFYALPKESFFRYVALWNDIHTAVCAVRILSYIYSYRKNPGRNFGKDKKEQLCFNN